MEQVLVAGIVVGFLILGAAFAYLEYLAKDVEPKDDKS